MANDYPVTDATFMSEPQYYTLMNFYELDPDIPADVTKFNEYIVKWDNEAYGDVRANIQKKYSEYLEEETWIILKRRFIVFRAYEGVNQDDYANQQLEQYRLTLDNSRLNAIDEYGDALENESGKRVGFFVHNNDPTVVKR